MRALVVGGTGPTGHFMVNGLRERGYTVEILHSGRHEIDEVPHDRFEHIHADAYDIDAFSQALGNRTYDLTICCYGRLRAIARHMQGRTGRFLSVGGVPAIRGYMNPELYSPPGCRIPAREDGDSVTDPTEDEKGYRIVKTEEAVFECHPDAAHLRYPYVYGPYQALPREWLIVRRILDGRPHIVLPDNGLTLHHYGYAENLAHAMLLAVDKPQAAAGQIFHAADDEVLSLRQVVEIVAAALDSTIEIVSMPWELATPAKPLIAQPLNTHRVLDLTKLRTRLGYRDKVEPREALRITARWLREHPCERGGPEEYALTDPFDYAAEDRLVAAWRETLAKMPTVAFETEPDYTMSYSGPGGRPRSKPTFEQ